MLHSERETKYMTSFVCLWHMITPLEHSTSERHLKSLFNNQLDDDNMILWIQETIQQYTAQKYFVRVLP